MVTKAVGTGDMEDSTSLSTDSGSAVTPDGKVIQLPLGFHETLLLWPKNCLCSLFLP